MSAACGDGMVTSRFREVLNPPGVLGKTCPRLVEVQDCLVPAPCDTRCGSLLGEWMEWGVCSAMCDVGSQMRRRKPVLLSKLSGRCSQIGSESKYCVASGGRLCKVPSGAASINGQSPDEDEKRYTKAKEDERPSVLQRMQLVGLRDVEERHHIELQREEDRDAIVDALADNEDDNEPIVIGQLPPRSGEGPALVDSLDRLKARVGWRIIAEGALRNLPPSRRSANLSAQSKFPLELTFASHTGNTSRLMTCLKSWLAHAVLGVRAEWVRVSIVDLAQDPGGGWAANADVAAVCTPIDPNIDGDGEISISEQAARAAAAGVAKPTAWPDPASMPPHCQQTVSTLSRYSRQAGFHDFRASLAASGCLRQAGFTTGGLSWLGHAHFEGAVSDSTP